MHRKIDSTAAEIGMYVVSFGGSWFDHPFWRSKFKISTKDELDRVRASNVDYVLIDEARGTAASHPAPFPSEQLGSSATNNRALKPRRPTYRPLASSDPATIARYRATMMAQRSMRTMRSVFSDMKMGWAVDSKSLERVLGDVVQGVTEDARTVLSVTRLKSKDDYTYAHSVAVCALMITIGQQRGMSEAEVRDLGLAGLLHDIGKIGVADDILKKPGSLTDSEFAAISNHPVHGFNLLSGSPGVTEMALDVCLHHHERVDGKGYPKGLTGSELSFPARLGAVCDVFDALTSRRAYKEAWPVQKALTKMWGWEGQFDRQLIFELMQVLHVFATGLLVRLSNGNLAVTLTQNPSRPGAQVREIYSTETDQNLDAEPIAILDSADAPLQILAIEDPVDWPQIDLVGAQSSSE